MDQTDQTEILAQLRSQVAALERDSKFLRGQMLLLLEALNRQESAIQQQQSTVARVDRIQMEMLTGTVWRSLRMASSAARRIIPTRLFQKPSTEQEAMNGSGKQAHLVCDEPHSSHTDLRSGVITVRGWCLAEGGEELVRISVDKTHILDVKPNIARPDVKKSFPKLDQTGRAGFLAEIDSADLPNGEHLINLELVSHGERLRRTSTSIRIDHEKGFASDYDRWIAEYEKPEAALMDLKAGMLAARVSISIIMPVFNTKPAELREAIDSVLAQSYRNWQLCIADDASTDAAISEILAEYAKADPRIRVMRRDSQGGISQACNSAWQLASGDYLAFLDHDDTLAPHALSYVVAELEGDPAVDFLYSDEDKLDARGRRYSPFFKPDWSPDLLLSENYICHFLVLRRKLAESVGQFQSICDGSQDYDLILRTSQKAARIVHIPKILYHWRASQASTASGIENKTYAIDAARTALERYCEQIGQGARVEGSEITGRWRMRYPLAETPQINIIIASGGKEKILKANIESIFEQTTYKNFTITVIDNSRSKEIESLTAGLSATFAPLTYIDHRGKAFNYSEINNRAARESTSPILLFLNDDTSVIAPGWLEAMAEHATRPEVGVVGAKLLYPDGQIQHAGVVMGLYDNCGHAFKGLDGATGHYFDLSDVVRNVCAVTGACLMTRSDVFWEVGGFDEEEFAVAFNDVDLCLKIMTAGYRIIYNPFALLYHYEAFSKSSKDLIPHPEEVRSMRRKWSGWIERDPYYSPNLTRNEEDFRVRTMQR